MCEPSTIALAAASMAASIGGAAIQSSNANAARRSQERANMEAFQAAQNQRNLERLRQDQMQRQADANLADTMGRMSNPVADQDTAAKTAMEYYTAQTPSLSAENDPNAVAGLALSGTDAGNTVVRDDLKKTLAKSAAQTRERLAALAQLQGTAAFNQDRGVTLARAGQGLSTLNGLRQGSLAVSGQEQSIGPANPIVSMSPLGSILSGAGQIGMGLAGSGQAKNWFGVTPATAYTGGGMVGKNAIGGTGLLGGGV